MHSYIHTYVHVYIFCMYKYCPYSIHTYNAGICAICLSEYVYASWLRCEFKCSSLIRRIGYKPKSVVKFLIEKTKLYIAH